MFSQQQLELIQQKSQSGASIDETAAALGIHRTHLERTLLKHHGMFPESKRTFQLITAEEYRAKQAAKIAARNTSS